MGLEEIGGREAAAAVIGHLRGFKVDVCSEFLRGPEQKRPRRSTAAAREAEPAAEDFPTDDGAPWTLLDQQQVVLCSRLPVLATGAEPWKPDATGHRPTAGFRLRGLPDRAG